MTYHGVSKIHTFVGGPFGISTGEVGDPFRIVAEGEGSLVLEMGDGTLQSVVFGPSGGVATVDGQTVTVALS